jgi:hypothetical protein
MNDIRIFQVEIETADDEAEYDLQSALSHLAETVAVDSPNGYRLVVTESGDEIFCSQSMDFAEEPQW